MDPMDSDDEYEYEYDDTETESFYLNLDLTSYHGPVRLPRRKNTTSPAEPGNESQDTDPTVDALTPIQSAEGNMMSGERVQVLGLHTNNPIVSYQNQIFSCSWADQIGTELVFSHPQTDSTTDHIFTPPLHQGPAFELLAANNVKILGRKANITSNAGLGLAQENTTEINSDDPVPAALSSQTSAPGGIPRRAVPPTHQAQFIQRLQSLKNEKGETDTVRTVMSTRRNLNLTERLRAWARTESQIIYVNHINQRAAEGDLNALAALEQLLRELPYSTPSSTSTAPPPP
ncbi:Transcription factor TFIIIC tau55-like protein [Penicillium capsulatum]|uniref:Transcription factor TFIIIC tau55-like protein n=1 Tax=Penicillium capsulatum TaxID=69766 RepID=A0A9W9LR78_9EURO|nr:Transcription factor TFIIIC tau55-like protein [Penicillium capsulatum]KAJ6135939.1 Transcription factor TFIIIC tau55-like protein [Penicillium capsulatum]